MAHKKGVGSTDNGRDSNSKRLGVKLFGGEHALAGNIIIRQRGTKYHPGENVYMGRDFTLHAKVEGHVTYSRGRKDRVLVSIAPLGSEGGNGQSATSSKPAEVKAATETTTSASAPGTTAAPSKPAEVKAATETTEAGTALGAAAAAPVVTPADGELTATLNGKKVKQDDLKIVEGIGPKIEELLHAGGITTWQALADAPTERVQEILTEAGSRYRTHNPGTWGQQAAMAVAGQWEALQQLQDRLDGGKEVAGQEEE